MLRALLKKLGFFKPSQASRGLYATCVDEARRETYYTQLSVPDTVDGRFDLISLMVSLLLYRIGRLKNGNQQATRLGQDLFEVMFADMDENLRAMGVSDEGIKYRIRDMSSAFMGRMRAYTLAMEAAEGDEDDWVNALARNVYRSDDATIEGVAALTGRVAHLSDALSAIPDDAISQGDATLPDFAHTTPAPGAEVT